MAENKSDIIESVYTRYGYKVFNKCPICLAEDIIQKGRGGTGNNKTHPQVFRCNSCGVFFVNPILDSNSLYKLYENFDITYGLHNQSTLNKIKRSVEYWDALFLDTKKRNKKLRFLDIGSSSGDLVKGFNEYGWESYGIEPCKKLVDYSIKGDDCISIQHSTVEEANYPDNYFDFIHFWHVLEHLLEPKQVLCKIYSWLKPGGILNLGTPSPDSIVSKVYPYFTGYLDLGSMHTFIFPQKTLNNLMKNIGFEIREHSIYSTKRAGSSYKAKIHNILHQVYPKAVQNFQRLLVYKK